MVESLKLQKLDSVIFYANWKNHYFGLTEKHIGPVFISKEFKNKKQLPSNSLCFSLNSFPINH